jgi:hypothetical protein
MPVNSQFKLIMVPPPQVIEQNVAEVTLRIGPTAPQPNIFHRCSAFMIMNARVPESVPRVLLEKEFAGMPRRSIRGFPSSAPP